MEILKQKILADIQMIWDINGIFRTDIVGPMFINLPRQIFSNLDINEKSLPAREFRRQFPMSHARQYFACIQYSSCGQMHRSFQCALNGWNTKMLFPFTEAFCKNGFLEYIFVSILSQPGACENRRDVVKWDIACVICLPSFLLEGSADNKHAILRLSCKVE